MKHRPYLMTHDCPHCGKKDEENEWGGARLLSTTWGHDFKCCSEECGKAFAKTHTEKEKTKQGRKELRQLWHKFQSQADYRLCGEPYAGYNAEEQLRSLGRR